MTGLTDYIDRQNSVIRIQSSIITDLIRLLMQHESVDEADLQPMVDRINLAAKLRADIGIAEVTDK
ncbi:MAG: hypothetical protein LUI87_02355 [Lachnospiraceae bacterium]|nr:hypothetical protein [Lachnospiraceae bacterium]